MTTNYQLEDEREVRPVRERLRTDLLAALKARDRIVVDTIRTMLSAIDNAEAVEMPEGYQPFGGKTGDVPRRLLTEEEIRQSLEDEREARRTNLVEYERLGKDVYAERLRGELEVFARYLD